MSRLYVESNFVLELMLAQEQRDQCESLLSGAEQGTVDLIVPAFCLGEPLETLGRRHRRRRQLHDELQAEVGQLKRVAEYSEAADAEAMVDLLATSTREDGERLELFSLRLIDASELVPLSADVVRRAFDLRRGFDLEPQDAFVLASVAVHLEDGPSSESGFVTKNTKDFDDPEIVTFLGERNCRLLRSFGEAVGFALHGA